MHGRDSTSSFSFEVSEKLRTVRNQRFGAWSPQYTEVVLLEADDSWDLEAIGSVQRLLLETKLEPSCLHCEIALQTPLLDDLRE